jgi:hypothetical protein
VGQPYTRTTGPGMQPRKRSGQTEDTGALLIGISGGTAGHSAAAAAQAEEGGGSETILEAVAAAGGVAANAGDRAASRTDSAEVRVGGAPGFQIEAIVATCFTVTCLTMRSWDQVFLLSTQACWSRLEAFRRCEQVAASPWTVWRMNSAIRLLITNGALVAACSYTMEKHCERRGIAAADTEIKRMRNPCARWCAWLAEGVH